MVKKQNQYNSMNTNGDILFKFTFTHNPYGQKYAPHFKNSFYFPSKVFLRLQFNSLESSSVAVNGPPLSSSIIYPSINTFSGKHEVFPQARVSMEMSQSDLRQLLVIHRQVCEACAFFFFSLLFHQVLFGLLLGGPGGHLWRCNRDLSINSAIAKVLELRNQYLIGQVRLENSDCGVRRPSNTEHTGW